MTQRIHEHRDKAKAIRLAAATLADPALKSSMLELALAHGRAAVRLSRRRPKYAIKSAAAVPAVEIDS